MDDNTDEALRQKAREQYQDDRLGIDADAAITHCEDSPVAWVQAWVRVDVDG